MGRDTDFTVSKKFQTSPINETDPHYFPLTTPKFSPIQSLHSVNIPYDTELFHHLNASHFFKCTITDSEYDLIWVQCVLNGVNAPKLLYGLLNPDVPEELWQSAS